MAGGSAISTALHRHFACIWASWHCTAVIEFTSINCTYAGAMRQRSKGDMIAHTCIDYPEYWLQIVDALRWMGCCQV